MERFLRNCSKRTIKSKEDNKLICPSIFELKPGVKTKRGLCNIVYSNGIWLDKDKNGISPEEFASLFPSLRMTIASSYSSTKENLRYRIYIPTTELMTAFGYSAVIRGIFSRMHDAGYLNMKSDDAVGKPHGFDSGKTPPSSLFYLPSKPADPSGAFFQVFKGGDRKPLDPVEWAVPEQKVDVSYSLDSQVTDGDGSFLQTPSEEGLLGEKVCSEWHSPAGQGNEEFFNLGLKLAQAGLDRSEIERKLYQQAGHTRSPEDRRRQIPSIMKSLEAYGKL